MHPNATVVGAMDVAAIGVAFGSYVHWLPDIAAGMSILFMVGRAAHWLWQNWPRRSDVS